METSSYNVKSHCCSSIYWLIENEKHETTCCFSWSLFLIEYGMSVRYFEDKEKRVVKKTIKPAKRSPKINKKGM